MWKKWFIRLIDSSEKTQKQAMTERASWKKFRLQPISFFEKEHNGKKIKLYSGYSYKDILFFSDGALFGSLIHDEPDDQLGEEGGGEPELPPLPPLPQPGDLCPQLCLRGKQQIKKYER